MCWVNQFLTRKNDMKNATVENPEQTCQFCYKTYEKEELIMDEMQKDIRDLVMKTKLADVS